jgi:hypothetical protein
MKGVFKHGRPSNRVYFSPCVYRSNFVGYNAMTKGTKVLWCGFDPATIIDIAGEWATIRFDDTHSVTITNIKHLEIV